MGIMKQVLPMFEWLKVRDHNRRAPRTLMRLLTALLVVLVFVQTTACSKQPVIGGEDDSASLALLSFEDVGDGFSGIVYRRINQFDAFVAQSKKPVLVVFYHPLGEINRFVIPRLEQLADDYQDKLAIVWIDAEAEPTLARNFDVAVMPQFTILVDASVKRTLVGYDDQGAANLQTLIAPYIS